jgi:hypothetical protein
MKKYITKLKELSKKNKIILGIISGIVLILVVALAFSFFYKKETIDIPAVEEEDIVIEIDNYIYKNGNLIFLNLKKEEIGNYECINKDEEICKIASYNNETEINQIRYMYLDSEEVRLGSSIYNEKFVLINDSLDNEEYILYNIETNTVLNIYTDFKKGELNTVILKNKDNLYGVVSLENEVETIIPFKYNEIKKVNEKSHYIFVNDDGYGIVNEEGQEIVKRINETLFDYNDKYLSVKSKDGYVLYDYDGIAIDESVYDFISLNEEYILFIEKDRLFLKDNELFKINEEGIKLINKYYVPVYYFNNQDMKESEERSFKVILNDNEIAVEVDNKTTTFNFFEVHLNKNYDYVNYINKKLYFYEDLEKKQLIGTYSCENDNLVNKDTIKYNNCFLAVEEKIISELTEKDSEYLPIFNNRFVFINDKKNLATSQNIILRDVVSNKSLAPYLKVDANFVNELSLKVDEADKFLIAAMNKNKQLGILKFENNEFKRVLPFEHKNISKYENYFLTKNNDDAYMLYDFEGKKLLKNETQNEILEYVNAKYILTKTKNNKYVIYSVDGNVIGKEYSYVIFFDNYYAAVNNEQEAEFYFLDNPLNDLLKDIDKELVNLAYKDNLNISYKSDNIAVLVNGQLIYEVSKGVQP